MKKRNHWKLMLQLSGLVKPLSGYMVLAVLMGLAGHLCATFITVFAGFAMLAGLGEPVPVICSQAQVHPSPPAWQNLQKP